jgi:hypothetical protein
MGEKAWSVRRGGKSVFGEMLDEPFIGDECCQLREGHHAFAYFTRQREKSRNYSRDNVHTV